MGVVDDSEFENEVQNTVGRPVSKPTVIDMNPKGRGIGNTNTPESLRKIIGETSEIDGRSEALALANQLGISPSSVSAYANGATSTASYDKPNTELTQHIQGRKDKISFKAMSKLKIALSRINEETLGDTTAREAAGIAKDMAIVIKHMEPDTPQVPVNQTNAQFIFYKPHTRNEESYDVIYAKE